MGGGGFGGGSSGGGLGASAAAASAAAGLRGAGNYYLHARSLLSLETRRKSTGRFKVQGSRLRESLLRSSASAPKGPLNRMNKAANFFTEEERQRIEARCGQWNCAPAARSCRWWWMLPTTTRALRSRGWAAGPGPGGEPGLVAVRRLAVGPAGGFPARLLAVPAAAARLPAPAAPAHPSGGDRCEVEERAKTAFLDHGLHRTQEGSGILILICLFEHRVQVLATTASTTPCLRKPGRGWPTWSRRYPHRRTCDALCEAIACCGDLLAENFRRDMTIPMNCRI